MNYLLMMPVRNEIGNLHLVAKSVIEQLHLPKLWLIVNDGSIDGSLEFIRGLADTYEWIIMRSLPPSEGRLGRHFAEVVSYGFGELVREAKTLGIDYDLIGKIDADVSLDRDCLLLLVEKFKEDSSLGIASPRLIVAENRKNMERGRGVPDSAFGDHPTDGLRLYRRTCLEEIGGIPLVRAPETVAEAKAKLLGWKLLRVSHIEAWLSRKHHSDTSLWARWAMAGSEAHYLGYHPLLVLGRICHEAAFERPRFRFLAYAWGYLRSCLLSEEQIEDAEIRTYFRRQRLKEVLPQVPGLLRRALSRRPR